MPRATLQRWPPRAGAVQEEGESGSWHKNCWLQEDATLATI